MSREAAAVAKAVFWKHDMENVILPFHNFPTIDNWE